MIIAQSYEYNNDDYLESRRETSDIEYLTVVFFFLVWNGKMLFLANTISIYGSEPTLGTTK